MEEKGHGRKIESMFDRISPRYDLLNRLISFGRDMRWRRRGVDLIGDIAGGTALDVCCGSGDFIDIFHRRYAGRVRICGIDFAADMLDIARRRFAGRPDIDLLLCRADALCLPVEDDSADAVTIGFGIRNILDRLAALRECRRALKPGGRIIMIEPSRPENRLVRAGFSLYFKYISPLIGGLLSGDRSAYRYLHDSFAAFPRPDEFLGLMAEAGFTSVKAIPQTLGTAMIYYGVKPPELDNSKT